MRGHTRTEARTHATEFETSKPPRLSRPVEAEVLLRVSRQDRGRLQGLRPATAVHDRLWKDPRARRDGHLPAAPVGGCARNQAGSRDGFAALHRRPAPPLKRRTKRVVARPARLARSAGRRSALTRSIRSPGCAELCDPCVPRCRKATAVIRRRRGARIGRGRPAPARPKQRCRRSVVVVCSPPT